MSTATAPAPEKTNGTQEQQRHTPREQRDQLPAIQPPRLPYHPAIQERFGIDKASWKALVEAIFPNATSIESIILALSYCRARNLDPFKRNVHIVPIWNSEAGGYVDTIWPGIGELRTTAFRTGEYAGRDEAQFGPDIERTFKGSVGRGDKAKSMEETVVFPEWARVTVYRMLKGQRVAFAGPKVYWLETYATRGHTSDLPNDMWSTRPRGQLEKCAEAAALRAAFPEEVGSEYIPEEVQHAKPAIDVDSAPSTQSLDSLAERLESQLPAPASDKTGSAHEPLPADHRETASRVKDEPPAPVSEQKSAEQEPPPSEEDILTDCERELATINRITDATDTGFAWKQKHPHLEAKIDQLIIARKDELRGQRRTAGATA